MSTHERKYERTADGLAICPACGVAKRRANISKHMRSNHPELCDQSKVTTCPADRTAAGELATLLAEARAHLARPVVPPPPPELIPPAHTPAISFWRCVACNDNTHTRSVRDPDRCGRCVQEGRTVAPPPPDESGRHCADCGSPLPQSAHVLTLYCEICYFIRKKRSDRERNKRWAARKAQEVDA